MVSLLVRAARAAVICLLPAVPASADSGIGLTFGEVTLAARDGQATLGVLGDFRIGTVQGVQAGLSLHEIEGETVFQADLAGYIQPSDSSKYGLFVSLSDIGAREATVGMLGAAGVWQVTPGLGVDWLAGVGVGSHEVDFVRRTHDFLHGAVRVRQKVARDAEAFLRLDVTDVREELLDVRSFATEIGVTWRPRGGAVAVTAALGRDTFSGRDAVSGETRARIEVAWRFGPAARGRDVSARAFLTPAPFDPLTRRGLF